MGDDRWREGSLSTMRFLLEEERYKKIVVERIVYMFGVVRYRSASAACGIPSIDSVRIDEQSRDIVVSLSYGRGPNQVSTSITITPTGLVRFWDRSGQTIWPRASGGIPVRSEVLLRGSPGTEKWTVVQLQRESFYGSYADSRAHTNGWARPDDIINVMFAHEEHCVRMLARTLASADLFEKSCGRPFQKWPQEVRAIFMKIVGVVCEVNDLLHHPLVGVLVRRKPDGKALVVEFWSANARTAPSFSLGLTATQGGGWLWEFFGRSGVPKTTALSARSFLQWINIWHFQQVGRIRR